MGFSFDPDDKILERIHWKAGKKLIFGSLLCLSDDAFQNTVLFATVAEIDHDKLTESKQNAQNGSKHCNWLILNPLFTYQAGTFEISFLPESELDFDEMENQNGLFTAVESTAYYEAYRHVLSGLQRMSEQDLPMSSYIVE